MGHQHSTAGSNIFPSKVTSNAIYMIVTSVYQQIPLALEPIVWLSGLLLATIPSPKAIRTVLRSGLKAQMPTWRMDYQRAWMLGHMA